MIYAFDDFEVDCAGLELRQRGKPIKADVLVLRLLLALLRRAGALVSKRELIDEVWEGRAVSENVITVAMVRLRKTLGQREGEREFVKTVHGRGYRFVQRVVEREAEMAPLVSSLRTERPFVGRGTSLERLRRALRDASEGRGSLCLIAGEPGIGKTRLVEELVNDAAYAGFRVVWAHCHASGYAPPLWPFVQLLRGLRAYGEPQAEAETAWRELAQLLPALEEAGLPAGLATASTHSFPKSSDAPGKHDTFEAVSRALMRAAQDAPLALVIDDVHRADATSFELLRFWVDRCPHARVLFLGTLREYEAQGDKSHPLSEVFGHRNCQRFTLPRLEERDVADYVRALLPQADAAVARAVLQKSEGNPFFMVELTRVLDDAQPSDLSRLKVPDAALSMLRQRVRALDDSVRGVLSAAAVIGRTFELSLLSQLVQEDARAVMEALDVAQRRGVVAPWSGSKTNFAFEHDLLKDVLYEGLSPAQRRSMHLAVAELLEARAEAGVAQPYTLLAHHFYQALPEGDPRKAVRYCTLAADTAIAGYAYADAVHELSRAREALSLVPSPSRRLALALLLRQTLCARVCRAEEFERLVRDLIYLARQHGASDVLAQAALLLGPHPGFASVKGMGRALRDALEVIDQGEAPLRAALEARLTSLGPIAFDRERSAPQMEEAFRVARPSGVLLAQHTVSINRIYGQGGPEHGDAAEETMRELAQLCRENPVLLSIPPVLLDLQRAIVALQHGDLARADSASERAEERARVLDSQELYWQAQRFRALLGLQRAEATREQAATLVQLHVRAARDAILGAPLLALHDQVVVLSEHRIRSAAELAVLAFDEDDPPARWSLKLRVLAALDQRELTRDMLGLVAPEALSRLPCDRDYLGTLGSVARAVLALNERSYAEALIELFAPYPELFAAHSSFVCEGPVSFFLGALSALLKRRSEAQQHFRRALTQAECAGLSASADEVRRSLLALSGAA